MEIAKATTTALVGVSLFLLAGCGNQQSSATSKRSSVTTTQTKTKTTHQQDQIVGSFVDSEDGAAIQLKSDGTGQYVYADSGEPDTNDQPTWKKDGDHYTVTLQDSNVSSPLTATLDGNQLTLSGDSNWNTEHFKKTTKKLDLNKFLADQHKQNGDANNGQNQTADTQDSNNAANAGTAQGNDGSQGGNVKDFTDSMGGHHHVVMSGATDSDGHQMGVDQETDPDGSSHTFQYVDGMMPY